MQHCAHKHAIFIFTNFLYVLKAYTHTTVINSCNMAHSASKQQNLKSSVSRREACKPSNVAEQIATDVAV